MKQNFINLENARLTFKIDSDYTKLRIEDGDSLALIAEIKLTPEELSSLLSGLSNMPVKCTVGDVFKLGKKQENTNFTFEIGDCDKSIEDLERICREELDKAGMFEWFSDGYYGSRGAFTTIDGKKYAKTIIRCWV